MLQEPTGFHEMLFKHFVAKVPLNGLIDVDKHLVLALCEAASAVTPGEPSGLLDMALTMLPIEARKAPGVTCYIEGRLLHQVLTPLVAPGFAIKDLANFDDLGSGLRNWFRLSLPPKGNTKILSSFIWMLIDQVNAQVKDPTPFLKMTLEYLPMKLLPPRDGDPTVKIEMDVVYVKEMLNGLIG